MLLAMLDLASTNIQVAIVAASQNKEASAACLTKAVDTYGSGKSRLLKLELRPEHVAIVRDRLDIVRQRLWGGPTK